jgi:hypothetical protein
MACCCKGGLLQSSLQAGVAQIKCRGWRVVLLQHEEGCLNWIKFQICLFLVRDFVDVDNLLIFFLRFRFHLGYSCATLGMWTSRVAYQVKHSNVIL